MLQFRHRVDDERRPPSFTPELFPSQKNTTDVPQKKYRVQSFFYSDTFPKTYVMPWNKSFPQTSCVYRVPKAQGIANGFESIPVNGRGTAFFCQIVAVRAPYQSEEAHPDRPDIFFLLKAYDP